MKWPSITSPKPVLDHLTSYIYAGALLALALFIIKTNDMNDVALTSFMGVLFWVGVLFLQAAGLILWLWTILFGAKQTHQFVANRLNSGESQPSLLPMVAFLGYCCFAGLLSFIIFVFSALQAGLIS